MSTWLSLWPRRQGCVSGRYRCWRTTCALQGPEERTWSSRRCRPRMLRWRAMCMRCSTHRRHQWRLCRGGLFGPRCVARVVQVGRVEVVALVEVKVAVRLSLRTPAMRGSSSSGSGGRVDGVGRSRSCAVRCLMSWPANRSAGCLRWPARGWRRWRTDTRQRRATLVTRRCAGRREGPTSGAGMALTRRVR